MLKNLTLATGLVFLLVGLLGFIPNPLVGKGALFETDLVHNLVHLLTGAVALGLFFLKKDNLFKYYFLVFGAVYLLVAFVGFVQGNTILGILAINQNDNILHLILGVGLIGISFLK